MSTCDKRALRGYLWLTVSCALFAAVYQAFGHGVTSLAMQTMFLSPLVLGVIPTLLARQRGERHKWWVRFARRAGIATLIAGGGITGIIEIYGTTSTLTSVYWIAGALLTTVACIGALTERASYRRTIGKR